jgi:hypothetical protein
MRWGREKIDLKGKTGYDNIGELVSNEGMMYSTIKASALGKQILVEINCALHTKAELARKSR